MSFEHGGTPWPAKSSGNPRNGVGLIGDASDRRSDHRQFVGVSRPASTVHAYSLDTGIRFTHTDFGGRATSGFDAIDGGTADDCHGHGTHVAGTTGGRTSPGNSTVPNGNSGNSPSATN